jgi:RND superfamily putative drug exporter
VLAAWGVLAVLGVLLTGALLPSALTADGDVTTNPESRRAQELIDARLPNSDAVDEVIIVRSDQARVNNPAFRARVRALVADAQRSGSVDRITSYLDPGGARLVSADRHAALVPVVLREEPEDSIETLVPIVERADGGSGFAVDITGEFTVGRDFGTVSEEDLRQGELQFGLPAAMIVLLLVFGTLVGAAIPLIMAVISIVVALGLVAVAGQIWVLNLFVTNMLVAMGLALGIDYSLFIVSRLREERARGADQRGAILAVASTATRAVVFSGTAFALAMVGMLLMPDTILRSLAFGAIVVGLVSVLVALTFHPALLMLLGDRVDRLQVPWLGRRVAASAGREGRFWGAVVRAVIRRPALSLVASVALLLAAASACGSARPAPRACPTRRSPSRGSSRSSATSPAARPTRSTSWSTRRRATRGRGSASCGCGPSCGTTARSPRGPRCCAPERASRCCPSRSPCCARPSAPPKRSTGCATTTCPPHSATAGRPCWSAAGPLRTGTTSRSSGAGCRS